MSGACGGPTLASDTYGKTLSTMDSLRDTLRDEHTCLLQAPFTIPPPSRTPLCAPSPALPCSAIPLRPISSGVASCGC